MNVVNKHWVPIRVMESDVIGDTEDIINFLELWF